MNDTVAIDLGLAALSVASGMLGLGVAFAALFSGSTVRGRCDGKRRMRGGAAKAADA